MFTGTPEGYLKAFDARNGKQLWNFNTGSGVVAPPITWQMDGEQYIGVASGWGGGAHVWGAGIERSLKSANQGGSFRVFKLAKPQEKDGQ